MTDHEQIIAFMQHGRWADAEERLQTLLARDARDARALRLMGTVCHLTGRPADARRMLERSLDVEPDNTSTLINLGGVHLQTGDLHEARRCFEHALAVDPASSDGHYNLGLVAQHEGRLDEAEQHYASALERDPAALDAAANLAVVHVSRGRHERALDAARRVLAREAGHPEACRVELKALVALGRLDEAQRALSRAPAALAAEPEMLALEGRLRFRAGRLTEAAAAYRAAIAAGDPRLETGLDLARCLLESGEPRSAIAVLDEAGERFPQAAECQGLLGLARHDAGDLAGALAAYERALALAPGTVGFETARATVLFELGREEAAERAVHVTMAAAPGVVHPHLLWVERLAARGDLAGALTACEGYLASAGTECNMLAARAFLLHALGREADAAYLMDYDRLIASWVVTPPDGYPDLAGFNAALAGHVRAHPSLSVHNAASKATQHGRQSGNLLFGDKGPFADFEELLWRCARRYVSELEPDPEHPFRGARPPLEAVYCWAVVLERSGYQTPHIHPTAWLSGVYYPELPATVREGTSEEGWIEFGVPPPELAFDRPLPTRRVRPREGLIVLFPSYFYHRTVPCGSAEQRVSIAFDFSPGQAR